MKLFRRADKTKPTSTNLPHGFTKASLRHATRRFLNAIYCSTTVSPSLQRHDLSMLILSGSRKWCSAIDSPKEWQSGKLRLRYHTNEINAMDVAKVLSPSLEWFILRLVDCKLYSTKFFSSTYTFLWPYTDIGVLLFLSHNEHYREHYISI